MTNDATLVNARKVLLDRWLRGNGPDNTRKLIHRRPGKSDDAPLSFAQQRLWFLDQFELGTAFYNIPVAIRLTGALDVAAFRCTINEIVRRHEALRTTFATVDGTPVQVIAPLLQLTLPITDLSDLPHAEGEARALRLAQDEAQTPFDLSTGPLIRAGLIRMAEAEHILLLTLHHIVSDGWSMGVLVHEVASLYTAYARNQASPLAELPIQYADFAHWQRQWLTGDVLARQINFWHEQIADAPTLLALPTDRPRPAVQTHRGAILPFTIAANTTAGLQALSRQTQSTLFMTLAAAFNVLLSRYASQADVCIGTPIANRNRAETESLIGFFVNTLVLRTQIDSNKSFIDLLQQVRTTALGAFAHQDVPFEYLVEVLKPQRHTSHSPLFQVMLALQNAPMGNLDLPGLTLTPVTTEYVTAKFDLSLNLSERADHLAASLEYNTDLFDVTTIERMAGHFNRLLEAIVADPTSRVADLPMLSQDERHQLLVEWNDTATDYPRDQTIHQLFEAQVEQTPNAIAVVFEGDQLSYAELNARANQLAHHLRSLGVGPDILVANCVERSLEMIIGLLGILKAGGAYLPLDPAHPKERLAFMLDDAKPAVLLTQQHLRESSPTEFVSADIALFCLDTQWTELDRYPADNLHNDVLPGHLAYVIYTSGSTGRPKGVLIAQQHLVITLLSAQIELGFSADDRLPNLASCAFDISLFELMLPLIHGGTAILLNPHKLKDLAYLTEQTRDITFFHAVPSFMDAWLNFLDSGDASLRYPALRYILVGGEAVPDTLLTKLATVFPHVEITELYGPTEATMVSTFYRATVGKQHPVLYCIGKHFDGTQIYLLDANLSPVPIGVAGELHIAGDSLARGYLNRPDLTADKFIPNPFGMPGSRMYKSGDLARYLPDGNIEYFGRIDHQVKIRGFRIELGEIEAALAALPSIRDVVVLAREDIPGDKRLVAYLVPHDALSTPELPLLRSALAQSLPDYMIPAHFMFVDILPLTPNGKIDRKALPAPDMVRNKIGYVAPSNPIEETLVTIWADVLKLDRVSVHDNFFELGGHSLLATQVISKLRTAFQVDLPLRTLFEAPIIEALALRIDSAKQDSTELAAPAIIATPRTNALALSFAQQRLWFLDQFETGSSLYNIPTAVRLVGNLDIAALTRTVNKIVRRHEALRTTFASMDGTPLQIIAPVLEIALPLDDLRDLPYVEREIKAKRLADLEVQTPFNLNTGPLIRASLLRLTQDEHILLLTLHHIVSDGWSMGILVHELTAIYASYVQGLPSPMTELAIQYADFAIWQRNWLQKDVLKAQVEFWTTHLAGAPNLLELPTDRPRPATQSYKGSNIGLSLTPELSAEVRNLSKRNGTTVFMTLLAAWSILLSRWSGQRDIVIGTPIANRQRSETESLIGFFANTLALRIRLDANPTVKELLSQVKANTLDIYSHQDLPFDQIVEILHPTRSQSHAPIFQVQLTVDNTPQREAIDLPDLTLSRLEQTTTAVPFDLILSLADVGATIGGNLAYSTDLFDRSTIERMTEHLQILLSGMANAENRHVHELPLLSQGERRQILNKFNDISASSPHDKLIHQLFEEQVANRPNTVALVFEDRQLTYAELNERANQLANHLMTNLGIRPGNRVAICLERGIDMMIGLLGILKAGCAYVPLDPNYPLKRLAFMLNDCAPSALVTQESVQDKLPALGFIHVLLLENGSDDYLAIAMQSKDNPDPIQLGLTSNHVAYVIYTSGSTGQPKGVMVQHRGLSNLAITQSKLFGIQIESRVLQFASLSFDASVSEYATALCSGAALYLASKEALLPGDPLVGMLNQNQITHLTLPPSVATLLSNAELPTQITTIVAGETCPAALANNWPKNRRLFNAYGPTEATVCATVFSCQGDDFEMIPIGRPIANTQIYILDQWGQPVPIGVVGEIYIGGMGVALGYLNLPELTAERFLNDPFSHDTCARMYKTGDLGRWLTDGTIGYVGRNDFQVKLRGFRIEPGEVESKLGACAGVQEAVVIDRGDKLEGRQLVAYLTSKPNFSISTSDLRNQLTKSLPEFMIPAHFVIMGAFPLTPNGKIDRKALQASDMIDSEVEYVAPRNHIEEILAIIWADVLKRSPISVLENFFELGGHSLLAAKLISRIRTECEIEIALPELFAHPTVSSLAKVVQQNKQTLLSPIPAADRTKPLPLSWAQQRLWFLAQLDQRAGPAYHMPVALHLKGALDRVAFQAALDRIVNRHEILRTTLTMGGEKPAQIVWPSDIGFQLVHHDLRRMSDSERKHEADRLIAAAAENPFDLSNGPLIRGQLLHLSEDEYIWSINQHHIISDGWSTGILIKELSTLYIAFVGGQSDPLPPLLIQYVDYSAWQRQLLQGEKLQSYIDFWRHQLSGAPLLLQMLTDRPRPAVQSYVGDTVGFVIPAELTTGLRKLSQRHGATLFMTLLGAFATLLARMTGQYDVVIGTPVANRQRTEIEALVGLFVNTLALRIKIDGNPSVTQLIANVKAVVLAAFSHQDLPFEQVVEVLQPPRSLSHSPIFQVMLTLNNTPDDNALTLPGLTVTPVTSPHNVSQFDMSMALKDTGKVIVGSLEYARDLFNQDTIQRLLNYFQILLSGIVHDDQQCVRQLPILGDAERHLQLHMWNQSEQDFTMGTGYASMFARQVAEHPHKVAVSDHNANFTYEEIDERSTQIANTLINAGAGRDTLVTLVSQRDATLLTMMIGVFKAGAAFLAPDISHPSDRLRDIIEMSGSPLMLVSENCQKLATVFVNHQQLSCIKVDEALLSSGDRLKSTAPGALDDLAYVIFTSGSTGKPKGVMVEQGGMLNHMYGKIVTMEICSQDSLAQTASPAFDICVWQFLTALLVGGRTVILPDPIAFDPACLLVELMAQQITLLQTVPSMMRSILDMCRSDTTLPTLRYLIPTGEALTNKLCQDWFDRFPKIPLMNVYGPAECSDDITWHVISTRPDPNDQIPIGRPTPNNRIYILDTEMQPVPIGVKGEICAGGKGVGRGYLNNAEQTKAAFVPHPFKKAERFYRTGDVGRYRPDGTIEFHGRIDFQVKIRGHRIELGEIETRLERCKGVKESLVLAQDDQFGDKRLVAYIVAQPGFELSPIELRTELAEVLTSHMLPSAYVILPRFPLTPNGKLDRDSFPTSDLTSVINREYVAPEGAFEITIASIWQDLLGLSRIGRFDDFFELGGHSLLAVQMISRINLLPGVNKTLRDLFSYPTLSEFSNAITDHEESATHPNLISFRSAGRLLPLFCIHDISGEPAYVKSLIPWLTSDLPVYGLGAKDFDLRGKSSISIPEIATLYIEAIRQVQPKGPYRILGYSLGGSIAYEIANQLLVANEKVEFIGVIDGAIQSDRLTETHSAGYGLSNLISNWAMANEIALLDHHKLGLLEHDKNLDAVLNYCHAAGLVPPEIGKATLSHHISIGQTLNHAYSNYFALASPKSRVFLFTSTEFAGKERPDDSLGWRRLLGESLHMAPIGGNHFTIMKKPHVELLGKAISAAIEKSCSTSNVH